MLRILKSPLLAVIVYWSGIIASILTYSQHLYALPTGGTVVEGSASINTDAANPNHQVITQSSPKAIINWSSFNIDANQMTEFRQPSVDSIALNRVTGGDPSMILGSLKANGQVWIVNPAGILFGRNARVDVAGLLATTADIHNADFMKGTYLFKQPENRYTSVINEGHIQIGDSGIAYLVAPGVRNSGVIEAKLGKVVLASGTTYIVDLYGDGLIHFATNAPDMTVKPRTPHGEIMEDAVRNSGEIITEGGKVLLTTSDAKQVVENVINMDGVIQAQTAVVKKGEIYLYGASKGPNVVKVTGKMEAKGIKTGEKGGKITVTGNKVGLFAKRNQRVDNIASNLDTPIGPVIDVSGDAGGGDIRLGGDFKGKGDVPIAEALFVAKESQLFANALTRGNGGKIIAWSDKSTRFYGTAHAKGGIQGGNGGLIETSAKWIDTHGSKINASSPKGVGGTWLLDPLNVLITDVVSSNGTFSGGNPDVWTPTASPSLLRPSDIEARLNAGTSVTVTTGSVGDGFPEAGDITSDVTGGVFKTAGAPAALTLQAVGAITIGGNIGDIIGNFTLVLNASGAANTTGAAAVNVFALQIGSGSMSLQNNSSVNGSTTGGNGNITFSGQGAGPFFLNTTQLFPPTSGGGSSGTTASGSTINSALAPGNFNVYTGTGGTGTGSTTGTSNVQVEQAQTTQQQTAGTTQTTTTGTTSASTTTTSTTTTETTTTGTTSTGTTSGTTPTTTETSTTSNSGGTSVDTTGAAPMGGVNADAPSANDAIGGGMQEMPTTAEGRGGSEILPVNPEDLNFSDFSSRLPDPNISPEYNNLLQNNGPVSETDLATDTFSKDPGLLQETNLDKVPVLDPIPATQEIGEGDPSINTAEEAGGQEELLAEKFNVNEGVDKSYDDVEKIYEHQSKGPVKSDKSGSACAEGATSGTLCATPESDKKGLQPEIKYYTVPEIMNETSPSIETPGKTNSSVETPGNTNSSVEPPGSS